MPGVLEAARQAGVRENVFHRAFDVTPDPHEALLTLIDLGVTRILTSGREPTALKGAPLIRALAARAAGGSRSCRAAASGKTTWRTRCRRPACARSTWARSS